jgi:hypothetical protein
LPLKFNNGKTAIDRTALSRARSGASAWPGVGSSAKARDGPLDVLQPQQAEVERLRADRAAHEIVHRLRHDDAAGFGMPLAGAATLTPSP